MESWAIDFLSTCEKLNVMNTSDPDVMEFSDFWNEDSNSF